MTVSFGAAGSGNTSTTSVAISWPSVSAGDYVVAIVANGDPPNSTPTESSTLELVATAANTDGTFGDSTGPRRATAFGVEASGSESGSVTFSQSSGGGGEVIGGIMYRFERSTANDWAVTGHSGDYSAGDAANIDITFSSVDLATGDLLFIGYAAPDDTSGVSGQTLAASGITVGSFTEHVDVGQALGDDIRIMAGYASVTAGSGVQDVTFTATEDLSCGVVLVVLRDRALAGGTDAPAEGATGTGAASAGIELAGGGGPATGAGTASASATIGVGVAATGTGTAAATVRIGAAAGASGTGTAAATVRTGPASGPVVVTGVGATGVAGAVAPTVVAPQQDGGGMGLPQLFRQLRAFNRAAVAEGRRDRRRVCPHSFHHLVRGADGRWRCPFDGWTAPR